MAWRYDISEPLLFDNRIKHKGIQMKNDFTRDTLFFCDEINCSFKKLGIYQLEFNIHDEKIPNLLIPSDLLHDESKFNLQQMILAHAPQIKQLKFHIPFEHSTKFQKEIDAHLEKWPTAELIANDDGFGYEIFISKIDGINSDLRYHLAFFADIKDKLEDHLMLIDILKTDTYDGALDFANAWIQERSQGLKTIIDLERFEIRTMLRAIEIGSEKFLATAKISHELIGMAIYSSDSFIKADMDLDSYLGQFDHGIENLILPLFEEFDFPDNGDLLEN